MSTRRRTAAAAVGAVILLVATAGCDEVRIRQGDQTGPAPEPQQGAVKSLVTPEGLGSLFAAANPDGFPVEHAARRHRIDGRPVTIGPITQAVPVESWASSIEADRISLRIRARDPFVTVPVQFRSPGEGAPRICRFRAESNRWRIEYEAANFSASQWNLRRVGSPSFETGDLALRALGSCGAWTDGGEPVDALRTRLEDYIARAVELGTDTVLDVSPFETLGLIGDQTDIERVSPYGNRRGAVRLTGGIPATGGVDLGTDGLETTLEFGAAARRADCAPPVTLDPPQPAEIGPVESGAIQLAGADSGLAIARPLLARLVQSATVGGFFCRGLESTDGAFAELPKGDLRLGDVGLGGTPVQGPFEVVLSPGSVPEVELKPDDQVLRLHWSAWTVELYGTYADAPVRLLRLTTSATLALRPDSDARRQLPLEVRAVEVADVSLNSHWSEIESGGGTLRNWARRLLLLIFDGTFTLPLPLSPGAPSELVRVDVRAEDVLLLFQFPTSG